MALPSFAGSASIFALLAVSACTAGTTGTETTTTNPPSTPQDPSNGGTTSPAFTGTVDVSACGGNQPNVPLVRCVAPADATGVTLAVCGDLGADNTLTLDALSPANAGVLALGVEGHSRTAAPLHVAGSFTSLGGIEADNTEDVSGVLSSGADLTVAAPLHVGSDAFVGGSLVANNTVSISGTLHVGANPSGNNVTAGSVVNDPVTVAAPLDCFHAPNIASLVHDTLQPSVGDLAAVPLDALASITTTTSVNLGCGRYHFSGIGADNVLSIHIDGSVVMILDGDFRIGAPTTIDLAPGATLDLIVAGNLEVDNTFSIHAAGASSWVGVGGDIKIGAPVTLDGYLVAPSSNLEADNTLAINGAAYVGALHVAAPLVVTPVSALSAGACVLP